MPLRFNKKRLALAVSFATCAAFSTAHAEDATNNAQTITLEEVVVTAQKREQNMQDTPISMQSFNAEEMQKQSISDIGDAAQYMPNVMVAESSGGSTGATIAIRGSVTLNPQITLEPTVGIYVDGVFVAKNVGGLFDVAELERLEVLRGPQGTLYGKNTIGGAINLVTRKPGEEFGGTLRVKAGNYNYTETFLSVDTGKFGDVASFNIAINKRDRDGFYKNTADRSVWPNAAKRFKELDSTSGRLAAMFDITDDLSLYYTFDMNKKDNTPTFGQFDPMGSKQDNRRSQGGLNGSNFDTSETQGHAINITWDISDELTFRSISAHRSMKFHDQSDYDGFATSGPHPYTMPDGWSGDVMLFHTDRSAEAKQYSQEFQFVGNVGPVSYVAGLYYFNEDTDSDNPFTVQNPYMLEPGVVNNKYGVNSESVAVFGQADWAVTDGLTLTAGLRWNHEEKESYLEHTDSQNAFDGFDPGANTFPKIKAKDDWQNVSPMAAISYLWDNGINTYFKIAQGWKAGGFNGEAGPDIVGNRSAEEVFTQSYDPEKVTSYELGMKSRWWDNRIQANVALFHDNVTDMQISNYLVAYSEIKNAGRATRQGLELDLAMRVTQDLSVNASYSYLHSKYKKYEVDGVDVKDTYKFPYAPKHKASVGMDYVADISVGELQIRLDYNLVGGHYIFDEPNNARSTAVKRHGILNGRVAIAEMRVGKNQTLEMGLWGKNLTDENYRMNGIPVSATDYSDPAFRTRVIGAENYYGDPRTFGADISYKW